MTDIVRVDALRHAIESEFPDITITDDQAMNIYERFLETAGPATAEPVPAGSDSLIDAARFIEARAQGLITPLDEEDIDAALARRRAGR